MNREFTVEDIPVDALTALDLWAEVVKARRRGHRMSALRITIYGPEGREEAKRASALIVWPAHRIGIASGTEVQWGDLSTPADIEAAIGDWLNDSHAWEGRNR